MTYCPLFIELCAGSAAVSLRLIGLKQPPIAFMGAKTQYAAAILQAFGLQPGQGADRVVLVDAGCWGAVWPVLLEDGHSVAAVLRSWREEDPRALWERLALPENVPGSVDELGCPERAAQWLWLQGRSCNNVPVWPGVVGWRMSEKRGGDKGPVQRGEHPDHRGLRRVETVAERVEAVAAAAGRDALQGGRPGMSLQRVETVAERVDAVAAIVCNDHATGRVQRAGQTCQQGVKVATVAARVDELGWWMATNGRVQPAAQRGTGAGVENGLRSPETVAERVDAIWLMGQRSGGGGSPAKQVFPRTVEGRVGQESGMQRPETVAARVEALTATRRRVTAIRADATQVDLGPMPPGTRVFIDPPYEGRTGYGWTLPRQQLLELAERCRVAGAQVVISEDEPLPLEGWHHMQIGREEWLTCSEPPRRVVARPHEQGLLL